MNRWVTTLIFGGCIYVVLGFFEHLGVGRGMRVILAIVLAVLFHAYWHQVWPVISTAINGFIEINP